MFLDSSNSIIDKELQELREEISIIKTTANKNVETLSADIKYSLLCIEKLGPLETTMTALSHQCNNLAETAVFRKTYTEESLEIFKKIKEAQIAIEKSNKLYLE